MKKLQLKLFLVASLPSVLFIAFAILILSDSNEFKFSNIMWIFVGLSLVSTIFFLFLLKTELIQPIRNTIADLHQNPYRGLTYNEPDELSLAIDSYVLQLERTHENKIGKLSSELNLLRKKSAELETNINRASDPPGFVEQGHDPLRQALEHLCLSPLKTLVAFSNGISKVDPSEIEYCVKEITEAARTLQFLVHEISMISPPETMKDIDPWQLVDNVLAVIAPLIISNKCTVSVKINASCPRAFSIMDETFKTVLFHYLLHYFVHSKIAAHSSVEDLSLELSFTPEDEIVVTLDSENYPGSNKFGIRLEQMLQQNITLEDGMLSFPAIPLAAVDSTPGAGLTGIIICESTLQRESLHTRLSALGVKITTHFETVKLDICVVDDESSEAFKAVGQHLNADVSIFLLNNLSLYKREYWHQLKSPIDHRELRQLLGNTQPATHKVESYSILAVDDNQANLRLLELQLSELGHEVTTATDGGQAVDLCQEKQFDLIFLDILMPGMGGIEAARLIHDLQLVVPPIVGLTAHVTNDERQKYLAAGMSQIVTKPIQIEKLKSVLHRQINLFDAKPPISAEKVSQLTIFDADDAISVANNRTGLADELFQILIANLKEDRDLINSAFDKNDEEELKKSVHKLNGAVKYCGVPRLAKAIDKLETVVKISDLDHIRRALNLLNNEIDALFHWHDDNPNPFGFAHEDRSEH